MSASSFAVNVVPGGGAEAAASDSVAAAAAAVKGAADGLAFFPFVLGRPLKNLE